MDVHFDNVRVVRGGRTALDVPGLLIRSGAVTAILGPNGAGKTTLLRAIAGLDRPVAGAVSIDGRSSQTRSLAAKQVAFAFQAPVFVSGTVGHNLELALRLRRVPRGDHRERIAGALAELAVPHLVDRDVRRLSGGEAQRVNLARTLMLRSPVVLLDEPLAGLDAPSREDLLRELPRALRSHPGATVVLVTHDRDEAARLADDIVLLLDGRVHASGTAASVFARPPDAESARFLGWTVLEVEGAPAAIAPGALAPGRGEVEFQLELEAVVPVGARWEAIGRIDGSPARVPGSGLRPAGPLLTVCTRRQELVRFFEPGATNLD
ncbi:MAG: ATP-binding cassette domain-containing protein [Tepidiformaceae bacterium]